MSDARDPQAHARRAHPETSHEAAQSVLGIRDSQWLVWSTLLRVGPKANHELVPLVQQAHQEIFKAPITEQSVRSRRAELTAVGLVEFTDEFHKSPTGRRARVWRSVSLQEYRQRQDEAMRQGRMSI